MLQKCELILIVKKYKLEEETAKYCSESGKSIEVLQLTVGHSELNLIELVWDQIKSEVARKNITFKISDVNNLVDEAIKNATKPDWMKAQQHIKKVEEEF